MGVYDNMNVSYQASLAPTMLESYLQRRALKNVEPNLGYLKDAQMADPALKNIKSV